MNETRNETRSETRSETRIVALIGLRGAGKSAVGRRLAEAVAARFLDLDEELAEEVGATSAGAALERLGESAFRQLEARLLERVLSEHTSPERSGPERRAQWLVLATGGGAVEHPYNRALLGRRAILVWLRASVETLQARLAADPTPRPSLTGADPLEELPALHERRAAWYAELADHELDTDRGGPEDLARELLARLFPSSLVR